MKETENRIFEISSEEDFCSIALDVFRYQASACTPYSQYINLVGIDSSKVTDVSQIPFIPIELYKTHDIYCADHNHELSFLSSGTTGGIQSRHRVAKAQLYIDSFSKGFEMFYSPVKDCNIFAVLPSYMENKNSSLLYMMENMVDQCHCGEFFLYNYDELVHKLNHRDCTRHTLLFGVSFALLDLAEQYRIDLSQNVTVMETGGMKGRRKEITREELHREFRKSFNVEHIHSEYGMCEALSQSYSNGNGVFYSPPWQRIMIRDLNNPFRIMGCNNRGGVNVIDLANIYSCSFIQTSDVGVKLNQKSFSVEGRIDRSDIRGCNLLIEDIVK